MALGYRVFDSWPTTDEKHDIVPQIVRESGLGPRLAPAGAVNVSRPHVNEIEVSEPWWPQRTEAHSKGAGYSIWETVRSRHVT